jgi:DNA-binding PadR family transcriptional regulator
MNAKDDPKPPIRGWVRTGARRGRWIEPFVLLLVAEGPIHGYSVIARLNDLRVNSDGIDVGMVYRTLRELDADGLVKTKWGLEEGPPRREYRLTPKGREVLDEWVAVMVERRRLIKAFLDRSRRIERPEGG